MSANLLTLLRDVREWLVRTSGQPPSDIPPRLDAAIVELEARGQEPDYGPGRCEVCGWTLADSAKNGCVPGNCSFRPPDGSPELARIRKRREWLASRKPAPPAEGDGPPTRFERTLSAATEALSHIGTGELRERLVCEGPRAYTEPAAQPAAAPVSDEACINCGKAIGDSHFSRVKEGAFHVFPHCKPAAAPVEGVLRERLSKDGDECPLCEETRAHRHHFVDVCDGIDAVPGVAELRADNASLAAELAEARASAENWERVAKEMQVRGDAAFAERDAALARLEEARGELAKPLDCESCHMRLADHSCMSVEYCHRLLRLLIAGDFGCGDPCVHEPPCPRCQARAYLDGKATPPPAPCPKCEQAREALERVAKFTRHPAVQDRAICMWCLARDHAHGEWCPTSMARAALTPTAPAQPDGARKETP